jgi:RNA polymerase sigma-70 factor (ECF subfamily)
MALLKLLPIGLAFGILQVALRLKGDTDLVRRLKARKAKAMSTLYDRYGRLAYSLIHRMVANRSDAEDLVQETFLHVWNRVNSFDAEQGALGPWMLAIARNRAIDHLRRQQGGTETAGIENPTLYSEIEANALSIDRVRRLKAAFETLTAEQREVIELACFEGLSQAEMAQRLRQPLETVKSRIQGALKVLREPGPEGAAA